MKKTYISPEINDIAGVNADILAASIAINDEIGGEVQFSKSADFDIDIPEVDINVDKVATE